MTGPKKVIFISAAEASSDLHGAELVKKMNRLSPGNLEFVGVGGKALAAAGQKQWVDSKALLSMGFLEVLGRLPKIWKILKLLRKRIESTQPDLMVVVDYPDFHFKLVRSLKEVDCPKAYYIPPKVWVWRSQRIAFLREHFKKVLCIFPFEERFFSEKGLPQATFVGNPLLDELPLNVSRKEARQHLGVSQDDSVFCLMLGSRPSEIKHHFHLGIESCVRIAAKLRQLGRLTQGKRLRVFIPVAGSIDFEPLRDQLARESLAKDSAVCEFLLVESQSGLALRASDFALIKSGTSTLEAALLGIPHVVFYRTTRLSWWIFKHLIRYRGPVALTNLVAQAERPSEYWVPEILGPHATAEHLAKTTLEHWLDEEWYLSCVKKFEDLLVSLQSRRAASPSEVAARELLALLDGAKG